MGVTVAHERFCHAGVTFEYCLGDYSRRTNDEVVVLLKPPALVRCYAAMLPSTPCHVLELGLFEGGSAILLALLAPQARVISIDLAHRPHVAQAVRRLGLETRISLHEGVSQDDEAALRRLLAVECGAAPLDLVIDDASHQYKESRRSFEILFPFLGLGRHYVLEDWNWAHLPGDFQDSLWADKPALSNLMFELLMLHGSGGGWIEDILIRDISGIIRKGRPADASQTFRLDDHIRNRGRGWALT